MANNDSSIKDQLQHRIDFKTKPLGALGDLENLAVQVGLIQNTTSPKLINPTIVVFAADHGIANEGVSAYPQEVTHQMVFNFLNDGAAINVFCKQHNIQLQIVDSGVNFNFPASNILIDAKIELGTASYLSSPAITEEQFELCLQKGRAIVSALVESGTNIIGFGEMGIGNTSSASMLMSYALDIPLDKCVGKGTGVNDQQLMKKLNILRKAQEHHGKITHPEEILMTFGGFEMVQMYGAMQEAYQNDMVILVDGFIASSVFIIAQLMNPEIRKNAIFCHLSDESGHRLMLEKIEASPILNIGMRLGEGTGCAVAFPIIESAVNFLNDMASFESAGVSEKA